MKNTTFKCHLLLLLCFLSNTVFAQLNPFTVNLAPTPESCTGNGAIAITLDNATPGAVTTFTVYELPDTVTPIAVQTELFLGGLNAGQYRVVATMVLGTQSLTVIANTTVTNTLQTLAFQLSGFASCGNGQLAVNVTAGQAVSYEILSGPVVVAPQTNPVFTGITAGVYVVRVTDACGDALVQTYTLVNPAVSFELESVSFPECMLPACNLITVSNQLSALSGSAITFPVVAVYTLYPPTGPLQTFTQTVSSGDPIATDILYNLPFYYDQEYSYDLVTTDACGNVNFVSNTINKKLEVLLKQPSQNCLSTLEMAACTFRAPITVAFLSSPAGFDPSVFNAAHPGPFGSVPITYSSGAGLPPGNYVIRITDGCGRTAQGSIEIEKSVAPNFTVLPQNCGFGQVTMPAQGGSLVGGVTIVSAPATFIQPLPYNASGYITAGQFLMDELPAGTYVFDVVSVCADSYQYTVIVPSNASQPVVISTIRGCEPGFGSLQLGVQHAAVTQVSILAAPSGFPNPLPYDVSFNLEEGVLYMNGFPQGNYSLGVADDCGGQRTIGINIPGYAVTQSNVEVIPHCGSFDLQLNYSTNEGALHSYWLQLWNPFNNRWEHPYTGIGYVEGTFPDPSHGYLLANNQLNINILVAGNFRVLRAHQFYSNGAAALSGCVEVIKTFTFTGGPQITNAFLLPCSGGSAQIAVIATGLAPLQYFITTKDGQPFYVSNGSNNIFAGLLPGIYNFQVRDSCGNIVNRLLDFNAVPQPAVSQSVLCTGQNGSLFVQGFDFLSFQWWHSSNPTVILSTNATLNFTPFNANTHTGTYFVRIYSTVPSLCTDQTVSYTIPNAATAPYAGEDATVEICASAGTVDLFSQLTGAYHAGGHWEEMTGSGMLLGHNWMGIGQPFGTYKFKYTVNGLCDIKDEATITLSYLAIPATPVATATSVCAGTTLSLFASDVLGTDYAWTGPNGFASTEQNPQLSAVTGLAAGEYQVVATNGVCSSLPASVTVSIFNKPEFSASAGCQGNTFALQAAVLNQSFDAATATFDWTGPEGFTAHTNPVALTTVKPGDYTLMVTAANGCSQTQTVAVTASPCLIPSGISPNGDGRNERFDLTGFDVLRFKIFNRYGMVVFNQNEYTNQWHGQDNKGRELPDATYYYYIEMGSGEAKTGWVYVTR